MDQQNLFRYFIRKTYPSVTHKEMTNEQTDQIGKDFHEYLKTKLSDEQWEKIVPTPIQVIMDSEHPLKPNGFPAAYTLHFMNWIEEQKN